MLAILYNNSHHYIPIPRLILSAKRLKLIIGRNVMENIDISLQLGERWAQALKTRFPEKNTAKHIAACFNIETRTARSWLDGQTPILKYLYVAAHKLGVDLVAEILVTPNMKMVKINKELEELEFKVCQLGKEIRSIRGGQEEC